MIDPYLFLGLMFAAGAVLALILRHSPQSFFAGAAVLCSGLTVAAWYTHGLPVASYTTLVVGYALTAVYAACRAYMARPRPGWWNGAHERIEPTS